MESNFFLHLPSRPVDPVLLSSMHRLRDVVFRERLNWDVASRNRNERDCYDLLGPAYGLCALPSHQVVGCWRLLPTTGPNMLRDVFPELLGSHPMPESPRVWEISRFAVSTARRDCESLGGVQTVTGKLLAGLLECAMDFNLERIVAVTDLRFERILRRAGLQPQRFCAPRPVGTVMATAGWIDVNEANLWNVRRAAAMGRPEPVHHPKAA